MKKWMITILALIFCFVSFGQQVNDPNAEVREAKNFHGINVSNAFDVYITQGTEEAVAVSAADIKHRDRIKVEVKNGILFVGYDNDLKWKSGNKKLKAYISFKSIDKLTISGACDVYVNGVLKAEDLVIHQSGASDLKAQIEVKSLVVDLSGASDIHVTGSATKLSIEASGASSFKGFDLVTDNCSVDASGASDVSVTVNKEFSAKASGASDVHYKGEVQVRELKTSGASSINHKRS
jgi:hypothetical protein